jgi:putative ABC transport system ATP-binding protein
MVSGDLDALERSALGRVQRRASGADRQDGHIVCEGLVRIFKAEGIEVVALQGLDLAVDQGEMVAIVGASGSGKSTLLNILSGLDEPTAGTARVAGNDLLGMSSRQRLRYRRETVGFVWQQTSRNLLHYLTARENVALPYQLAQPGRRQAAKARAEQLLEMVGVSHCADRRPAQMSGGEQQRTAVAVAVANHPEVLFADEPTGELDEGTAAELFGAMESINRQLGVTVVIVTHDATVTDHVARTVAIRDGRTASEVRRHVRVGADGQDEHVAQEYALLDRAGRMQLPRAYVHALDLRSRVRLDLEPDHVAVRRDEDPGADSEVDDD